MNRSTYRFTLDLQKHQSQMSIAVFVHDSAVRLYISLTDGGNPYHIEKGGRAVFYGKRPNDTPLCHNCMIDDTGRIIYDFNDQTASGVGITNCQIRIYDKDGELITAPRFSIVADERVVTETDIEKVDGSPLAALDQIHIAIIKAEEIYDILDTKLENGEFNGANGKTPYIKDGNWWIDEIDTRTKAEGQDGKSAYEIAVENGYEGTEEEWLESLRGVPDLKQTTGQATDKAMSQKAVSDNFTAVEDRVTFLEGSLTPIGDRVTVLEGSLTPIEDRVTFLEDTLIEDAEYEVEDTFDTRVTAGGLTIPNGVETEVLKIEGDGETTIRGIKSIGENLLSYPYYETTKVSRGIRFTDNGDGTITLNGKNDGTDSSQFLLVNGNMHLERGKYSLCLGQHVTVRKYDTSGVSKSVANSFEIGTGEDLHQIQIWFAKGDTKEFNNFVVKPTLIRGSDYPSGYIPYVEDKLELPKEFKLYSVDNIRDEIDFANKKHIKKIEGKELKNLHWGRGVTWIDGREVACIYMPIGNSWWTEWDNSPVATPSRLQLINNGSYTMVLNEGNLKSEERITLNTITVEDTFYPDDYDESGGCVLLTGEQWHVLGDDYMTSNFFDYVGDDEIETAIKTVVGDSVIYYEIPPTELYYDWDANKHVLESNYKVTDLKTYLEPIEPIDTAYVAYRNGTESIIGEGKAKVTQKYIVLRS